MPDRLLGVLGNERLELAFGPLMIQKGASGAAEQRGKLGPRVRRAHIDNADRLDPRSWWLGIDEVRRLAGLHASPELLLRRDQDTEIERVHGDGNLDPLAAACDDREHRLPDPLYLSVLVSAEKK